MFVNIVFVLSMLCAAFIILLVLLQDDQGEGMGGIFSGGSGSPFGSGSGNFLQRTTAMFALFFLVTALGFAYLNKQSIIIDDSTEVGNWLKSEFSIDDSPPSSNMEE